MAARCKLRIAWGEGDRRELSLAVGAEIRGQSDLANKFAHSGADHMDVENAIVVGAGNHLHEAFALVLKLGATISREIVDFGRNCNFPAYSCRRRRSSDAKPLERLPGKAISRGSHRPQRGSTTMAFEPQRIFGMAATRITRHRECCPAYVGVYTRFVRVRLNAGERWVAADTAAPKQCSRRSCSENFGGWCGSDRWISRCPIGGGGP